MGESLAVLLISTVITSIKVHIISIMNAFATVMPGFGLRMASSERGTEPRKWPGDYAVYLFYVHENAMSVPNMPPSISDVTV